MIVRVRSKKVAAVLPVFAILLGFPAAVTAQDSAENIPPICVAVAMFLMHSAPESVSCGYRHGGDRLRPAFSTRSRVLLRK